MSIAILVEVLVPLDLPMEVSIPLDLVGEVLMPLVLEVYNKCYSIYWIGDVYLACTISSMLSLRGKGPLAAVIADGAHKRAKISIYRKCH